MLVRAMRLPVCQFEMAVGPVRHTTYLPDAESSRRARAERLVRGPETAIHGVDGTGGTPEGRPVAGRCAPAQPVVGARGSVQERYRPGRRAAPREWRQRSCGLRMGAGQAAGGTRLRSWPPGLLQPRPVHDPLLVETPRDTAKPQPESEVARGTERWRSVEVEANTRGAARRRGGGELGRPAGDGHHPAGRGEDGDIHCLAGPDGHGGVQPRRPPVQPNRPRELQWPCGRFPHRLRHERGRVGRIERRDREHGPGQQAGRRLEDEGRLRCDASEARGAGRQWPPLRGSADAHRTERRSARGALDPGPRRRVVPGGPQTGGGCESQRGRRGNDDDHAAGEHPGEPAPGAHPEESNGSPEESNVGAGGSGVLRGTGAARGGGAAVGAGDTGGGGRWGLVVGRGSGAATGGRSTTRARDVRGARRRGRTAGAGSGATPRSRGAAGGAASPVASRAARLGSAGGGAARFGLASARRKASRNVATTVATTPTARALVTPGMGARERSRARCSPPGGGSGLGRRVGSPATRFRRAR